MNRAHDLDQLDAELTLEPTDERSRSYPPIAAPRGPCVGGIAVLKPGEQPEPHWTAWVQATVNNQYAPVTLHVRVSPTEVQRLDFHTEFDARRFYSWNMTDRICRMCCSDESRNNDIYCVDCRKDLDAHKELRSRYERAQLSQERSRALWKRMEALGERLGDGEVSEADKAAVLDRLLEEISA